LAGEPSHRAERRRYVSVTNNARAAGLEAVRVLPRLTYAGVPLIVAASVAVVVLIGVTS